MPIFYLEPKNDALGDHSWQASNFKGGCWIEAETEEVARLRVQGATQKMLDVKPYQPLNIFSPWTQRAITDCRIDKPPRDIPAGKILTKSGQFLNA